MRRLAVALALLSSCEPSLAPVEGVYSLCAEVKGYSGEVLELRNGHFRYWFYSDVRTGSGLTYPLTGSYVVSGTTLSLDHPKIYANVRTLGTVKGVPVIWRDDGLEAWKKDQRLRPYGVLIRVKGIEEGSLDIRRPSIDEIK